jgi:hypothetical protein
VSQEEKTTKKKKPGVSKKGRAKILGYGLVVMFLMVWVFVLGLLTGRGDINRLFQRLGLYKTDLAARLGLAPDGQPNPVLPIFPPEETHKAVAELEKKQAQDAKMTQTMAVVTSPDSKGSDHLASKTSTETSKKTKPTKISEAKRPEGLTPQKTDHDHDLAAKLSFQNSLDTPPARKQSRVTAKKEASIHIATIAPQASNSPADSPLEAAKQKPACAYQVKVASYRTAEEAEKAMADLKKKGFKVSLQQGKDKAGPAFIIKTGRYTNKTEAEKVSQKLKEAKMNAQVQELKQ